MIITVEIFSLCVALTLSIICTKSDIQKGLIYNKTLLVFLIAGIIIDAIYYGFFAQDIFRDFIINFLLVTIICLYLFFSHSLAGGDCKLAIVLSLLYPARMYVVYSTSNTTLLFAVGFAIAVGYIYLVAASVYAIATKRVCVTFQYFKNHFAAFLKSYMSAIALIALINCIFLLCSRLGFSIHIWLSRLCCLLVSWCVGKYSFLRNKFVILSVIMVDIVFALATKVLPVSLYLENYILVFILLLCQMTIKTTIYECVPIAQLEKGMILSTFSSALMQSSITKGLPPISSEDLRSRLTSEEVDSIKIWAKATRTEEITILKKIPFAIFISLGFILYFILWSFVS